MDCCGSSKPKEEDKDVKVGNENNPTEKEAEKVVKESHISHENSPTAKEQAHGGCCGGGGAGMWLHLMLMIVVILVIMYISKR